MILGYLAKNQHTGSQVPHENASHGLNPLPQAMPSTAKHQYKQNGNPDLRLADLQMEVSCLQHSLEMMTCGQAMQTCSHGGINLQLSPTRVAKYHQRWQLSEPVGRHKLCLPQGSSTCATKHRCRDRLHCMSSRRGCNNRSRPKELQLHRLTQDWVQT